MDSTAEASAPPPPELSPSPEQGQPQIVVAVALPMRHDSFRMQCPACGAEINTAIQKEIGTCTHLAAVGLFFLTIIFFWVPYIVDCCKDTRHTCPNCGVTLGVVRRC